MSTKQIATFIYQFNIVYWATALAVEEGRDYSPINCHRPRNSTTPLY